MKMTMKKIFTLLLMASVMVAANARTLWTGSCTFADYGVVDGERPVFDASEFQACSIGDKLVFAVSNNASDPQSWHQLELWNADISKALAKGVQVLASTTDVTYTLDEGLLTQLKAGGFALAGTGYTVTSIELTGFDGIVWEGECLCPNWQATPPVNLPGSNFSAASEGDELVFYVEKIAEADYACIQIDRSTYVVGKFGTTEITEPAAEVKFVLDAELLSELQLYGINITGMNFKLTKIAIVAGGDTPVPPVTDAIWSGIMVAGDWANYLEIDADKFAGIKDGDCLEFTVTDASADGQIALKQRLAGGWEEMPSATEWGNYLHLTEGDCVAYFDVNADAAASIAANGLVVAGTGFTLTKVAFADF